jgi:hypothetical protein
MSQPAKREHGARAAPSVAPPSGVRSVGSVRAFAGAPRSPEKARFSVPQEAVLIAGLPREAEDDVDTGVVALSPALLAAIRSIAPRRRPSRLPGVFVLALIAVAAATGLHRPLREFLLREGAAALGRGAMRTGL